MIQYTLNLDSMRCDRVEYLRMDGKKSIDHILLQIANQQNHFFRSLLLCGRKRKMLLQHNTSITMHFRVKFDLFLLLYWTWTRPKFPSYHIITTNNTFLCNSKTVLSVLFNRYTKVINFNKCTQKNAAAGGKNGPFP